MKGAWRSFLTYVKKVPRWIFEALVFVLTLGTIVFFKNRADRATSELTTANEIAASRELTRRRVEEAIAEDQRRRVVESKREAEAQGRVASDRELDARAVGRGGTELEQRVEAAIVEADALAARQKERVSGNGS